MSLDRSPVLPATEAPPGTGAGDGHPPVTPPALRVQILATEHWSLLATRSLAWNEVFARAGIYLSLLSGSIVALALVGNGSGMSDTFLAFGVVLLPVVLFAGVTTHLRLASANYLDAQCVIGMNRIRAAYLAVAPDLADAFVTGTTDDVLGLQRTMAVPPGMSPIVHVLAATPSLVSVVNSVVGAAFVGFVILLAHGGAPIAIAGSILAFAIVFVAGTWFGRSRLRAVQAIYEAPTSD